MKNHSHSSAWPSLLIFVLSLSALGAAGVRASELVILGDSWGAYIGDSVRATLNGRGLRSMRIHNAAVPGSTADEWRRGSHGVISKLLAPDTNAMVVLLFLGGNDFLSKLPDTAAAAAAIRPATTNIARVLSDVAAACAAPILYSSYDYIPGPARTGGTALEINRWVVELFRGVEALVHADPVLKSRVTPLNNCGLMQVRFGIPKLGLPPFDPSLPNPDLPGPTTAFADDIHLTRKGYDILFQKIYSDFYARILERCRLTARRSGQFAIESAAGLRFELSSSPDLIAWSSLGVLTNATGSAIFEDAEPSSRSRFYRAVSAAP